MVAQLMLQGFGCRVDLAANGLEALSAATSRPYDAVLMDVAMPELDGVEATRQIRGLEGDVGKAPIIGLTAFAMAEDHERFRNAGMSIVLSKPINRDTLYDTVRASLSGKLQPAAQAPADAEGRELLDRAVLREMTASFSDEQVAKLLDRLVIDIETHATAAAEHARQGDVDGLSQSCHALKGLAASFGSRTLADVARRIEQQCRERDAEAAMAMALSDLDAVCAGSLDALRQYSEPHAPVRDAQ
jgi:CheY-like chemotaxis protein